MNLIADVCNQALDAIGSEVVIGDISEGTREAQVLLRAWRQCLMQLLRAVHWQFARKQTDLVLLGDATGMTPGVPRRVVSPWLYEYEYPIDCMKARFVPWNHMPARPPVPQGNIQIPDTPLMTNNNDALARAGGRLVPARFLVATDFNYPPPAGAASWEVQGVSPQGRTVILTNVRNAALVYTALMLYPSVWDPLFREAMVAYLGSQVALALNKDKKFGMEMRNAQIAIAKDKITQARITDGNEMWSSSDIPVDWMRTRNVGRGYNGFGAWGGDGGSGGLGVLGYGYDHCGFADGSAY